MPVPSLANATICSSDPNHSDWHCRFLHGGPVQINGGTEGRFDRTMRLSSDQATERISHPTFYRKTDNAEDKTTRANLMITPSGYLFATVMSAFGMDLSAMKQGNEIRRPITRSFARDKPITWRPVDREYTRSENIIIKKSISFVLADRGEACFDNAIGADQRYSRFSVRTSSDMQGKAKRIARMISQSSRSTWQQAAEKIRLHLPIHVNNLEVELDNRPCGKAYFMILRPLIFSRYAMIDLSPYCDSSFYRFVYQRSGTAWELIGKREFRFNPDGGTGDTCSGEATHLRKR